MRLIDTYSAKLQILKNNTLQAQINEEINVQRLRTMYEDYPGDRIIEVRFIDPRRFTAEQRRFIYALLGDIYTHTGQPVESLKEVFKLRYEALTGESISLKNDSKNTVSDANLYAEIVLDYIFEEHIPFRNGYDILPANQDYYFYKCITKRVCCICGKSNAEIDHFDKALGRRNRKKVDHTEYTFAALCGGYQSIEEIQKEILTIGDGEFKSKKIKEIIKKGGHHAEKHWMPVGEFKNKYHVKGIKLNQETIKKLGIGG